MIQTWNTLQALKIILYKYFCVNIEIEKSLQCEEADYNTVSTMYHFCEEKCIYMHGKSTNTYIKILTLSLNYKMSFFLCTFWCFPKISALSLNFVHRKIQNGC